MPTTIERIELVLPDFEASVYDPLISPSLKHALANAETLAYARKRVAMGRFCRETCELGRSFFARLGLSAVRTEVHVQDDWQHHFLALPVDEPEVTDEDVIIDPTYLQFARERNVDELLETRPSVFMGTRAAITELMRDQYFVLEPGADALYRPESLETIY